jgi:integrase
MAHTGMRIGEASELRWGRDVVLTGRPYLKLRWQFADDRVCEPKTRYGKRDIPLSPGLVRKLADVQPSDADGQLVFPSTRGTRLNRNNLQSKVLGPAARRAGVPWVTLHTFRHTCASLLFAPVEHGGRQERQAGPGVARPPLARVHTEGVRPPDRRRCRRGELLRRRARRLAS